MTPLSAFDPEQLDLGRMRADRTARLRAAMCTASLDALVLSGTGNVHYATGAASLPADSGRAVTEPTTAIVTHDALHVFASYPEAIPPDLPDASLHGPLLLEFAEGVELLAATLEELLGRRAVRVGFDEVTGAVLERLPALLPALATVDAAAGLAPAKLVKTADEVRCIRHAQHVNETAMYSMLETFGPGIRQSELTGRFLQLVHELGASNSVDPVWQVVPAAIADGPWTLHGDLAFPVASSDRVIRDGDLVIVDTGVHVEGYCSDFGRTWWAGDGLAPPRAQEHFAAMVRRDGRRARGHRTRCSLVGAATRRRTTRTGTHAVAGALLPRPRPGHPGIRAPLRRHRPRAPS